MVLESKGYGVRESYPSALDKVSKVGERVLDLVRLACVQGCEDVDVAVQRRNQVFSGVELEERFDTQHSLAGKGTLRTLHGVCKRVEYQRVFA